MESQTVPDQGRLPEVGVEPHEAVSAVSQTREAINLRLLFDLRRRLKSAAEKELAVGADRMRALRGDLRRGEAELRICQRTLEARAQELERAAARVHLARSRALKTCVRLSSLEHEHEDLAQQLAAAQQVSAKLQPTARAEHPVRSGTLDSFVLATAALVNDLSQAIRDQAALRARGSDLLDEGESAAARASLLGTCFQSTRRAMVALSQEIAAALDDISERVAASSVGPVEQREKTAGRRASP